MKILTLQIKRVYLEQILSGEKKEEYREVTDKNYKRFCHLVDAGEGDVVTKEGEQFLALSNIDAIKFLNGYKTDRPEVTVRVNMDKCYLEGYLDEKGEVETYTDETGEVWDYTTAVYGLGEVLERKNI